MMDYGDFSNFPFPVVVAKDDEGAKNFFYTLDDEKQLEILNKSKSYEQFVDLVKQQMISE